MHYLLGFFSEEDERVNVLQIQRMAMRSSRLHAEFLELRIVLQDKDECKLIPSLPHDTLFFCVIFGVLNHSNA